MTSQSLFLQVFVPTPKRPRDTVFFLGRNPFFFRSLSLRGNPSSHRRTVGGSQSLFLQVFVPTKIGRERGRAVYARRNPFFFRSLFLLYYLWSYAMFQCRNPFFFRSLFLRDTVFFLGIWWQVVAIPFSSGLCSYNRESTGAR